jgi:formate-dependent nitrite reductase membrane component NrfD
MFAESINQIVDFHTLRLALAVETRIPIGIWLILFALSFLGMMAMGYQAGIAAPKRSQTVPILVASFALVITLIAGLDRPNTRFVSVTQRPLIEAEDWMKAGSTQPAELENP